MRTSRIWIITAGCLAALAAGASTVQPASAPVVIDTRGMPTDLTPTVRDPIRGSKSY